MGWECAYPHPEQPNMAPPQVHSKASVDQEEVDGISEEDIDAREDGEGEDEEDGEEGESGSDDDDESDEASSKSPSPKKGTKTIGEGTNPVCAPSHTLTKCHAACSNADVHISSPRKDYPSKICAALLCRGEAQSSANDGRQGGGSDRKDLAARAAPEYLVIYEASPADFDHRALLGDIEGIAKLTELDSIGRGLPHATMGLPPMPEIGPPGGSSEKPMGVRAKGEKATMFSGVPCVLPRVR